jgi:predicted MPP superfamily phosphohydrolase
MLNVFNKTQILFSLGFLPGQGFKIFRLSFIHLKFLTFHALLSLEAKITEISVDMYDVVVFYCQPKFFSKKKLHYFCKI